MASYSDNFDRDNGEIGANWTEDNGDIDIVSNRADNQTVSEWNHARYASALDGNDHYSEVDIVKQNGDGPTAGAQARQASSTLTFYMGAYVEYDNGAGYKIWRFVNEVQTELDSAASGNGEKTVRITVDGATQSMEVDTVEVCTATDSDLTDGVYCGMGGYTTRASFNDWSAADLGAGGGLSIPVARRRGR